MVTMEVNLAQQLMGMVHENIFKVFLYVQKSHDSLDRGRCMVILRGYYLGPIL